MVLLLALVSSVQGLKAYRVMSEKAQAQANVTESVHRWKQNYLSLGASVKRWNNDYRSQDSIPDLMTLISVINFQEYGLMANSNTMFVNKIDPIIQGGAPIGLTKVCLASSNTGSALEVQAPSYQVLLNGIKRLAQRSDIHIETISIKGDKPIPVVHFGDFCALLSN